MGFMGHFLDNITQSNTMIFNCAECGHETDTSIHCSTSCTGCDKLFCCALSCTCFSKYHRKSLCKGSALTITNPKWICNLRLEKFDE